MFTFLILPGQDGEYDFIVHDLVGNFVLFAQNYRCRCSCEDDIDLLRSICHKDSSYERSKDTRGLFSFEILNDQKEPFAYSMHHDSEDEREDLIAQLKQYLPRADEAIVEQPDND